jgi:hypothetical protein
MTKATGIAMPTGPIDRNDIARGKAAFTAVLMSIVLAACGGGAQTTTNPITSAPPLGNAPYAGPVARNADVLKFQQEFWGNAKTTDRCGSCHNETVGQLPMFVRNDDVNMAYDAALTKVDTEQPSLSEIVAKVGTGHNCWVEDAGVCSTIMTTWIENWLGTIGGGGREIVLQPPAVIKDPNESKNFPKYDPSAVGSPFDILLHDPVLEVYCSGCHSSESPNSQQPYFADPDVDSAYDAAKPKIDLTTPEDSRLVVRLRNEFHNCWEFNGQTDCARSAQVMEDAITAFADGIDPTFVDPELVVSKALRLVDGTLASGGNRYEDAQVALWEFKTGDGTIAYDTSGVDPAIDLNLIGDVAWFGGWGITINDGKAQGSTTASKKLYDVIQESGEFSIEAWAIPANVTQEEAQIFSYSNSSTDRNLSLQQTLYDYDFLLRTTETTLSGMEDVLSTPADDEVLQATLQHVVLSYHPVDGRKIYVNGELVSNTDPVPGGTLIDWGPAFAVILGNEASSNGLWNGTLRLAAVHRRALTMEQVVQNYDVGVGEKFFLLFDISEQVKDIPETDQSSFVLFEAQQYDSYAYLFDKPHFVTLDGSMPGGVAIEGMRIGLNGAEAPVGQSYSTLVNTLDASQPLDELGQPLSLIGAVLPLEKGPEEDEFFLTFDRLGNFSYDRDAYPMAVITPTDVPIDERKSRIGIRTFDEINATYAAVTGVDPNTPEVDLTFQELRQSLPAIESIDTFLSSHQVAIAQLAIQYCDALIGDSGATNPYFPGFNLTDPEATAFSPGNRDLFVTPLLNAIMGTNLASQPSVNDVYSELASAAPVLNGRPDNLIDRLVAGDSNTRAISKGVCAAMLGSAVTLVQ